MNVVSQENAVSVGCHKISNVMGKNLFMSNGKAWHGLGMTVDSLFDFNDVREVFPELLYTIEHRPCYADVAGERVQITGVNAVVFVGESDGVPFEKFFESRSATDTRPIVQPAEWMQMLEDAFTKFGAKFSSAGSLYDGETFFVSAELPEGFSICGDEHLSYLNAVDNYTGMARAQLFGSSFRVVCRNTAKAAYASSENRYAMNHTVNMIDRVESLVLGFQDIVASRPAAIELLRLSASRIINPSIAINRVLDSIFGFPGLNINVTSAEMADVRGAAVNRAIVLKSSDVDKIEKLVVKQIDKRKTVFGKIMDNYYSDTCKTERGSAYSAYQAITEYANYGLGTKKTDRQAGNDFLSLANGKGASLTDAAWANLIVAG